MPRKLFRKCIENLKYSDIDLIPNYSELYSRADADTSVDFLGTKFMLPVVPANMKSVIDMDLARNMSEDGYFYIMADSEQLRDIVTQMNEENWSVISVSVGIKMHDKKDIVALEVQAKGLTILRLTSLMVIAKE